MRVTSHEKEVDPEVTVSGGGDVTTDKPGVRSGTEDNEKAKTSVAEEVGHDHVCSKVGSGSQYKSPIHSKKHDTID